ncbi:flavoprotein [Micromonospora sp. HUAS LYJ1]|nr:flavoprotein [Micromonospora sp. HUAS LYJ1]WKU05503.1 flavoprotein [Micromonospora sp. HUAS LYJ1]
MVRDELTDAARSTACVQRPAAKVTELAPATFNTINQWAAGINNTAALGILNEALGAGTPIIASPYVKAVLATHPAFNRNLELLASAGVHLTATEALRPATPDEPFRWQGVLDLLNGTSARPWSSNNQP